MASGSCEIRLRSTDSSALIFIMDAILKLFTSLIPFLAPYPGWVKVLATLWVVITALLLAGLLFTRSNSVPNVVIQAGEFPVVSAQNNTIDVFYPNPFMSQPNLTIEYSSLVDFEIVEQKPEGFRLKLGAYTTGSRIVWHAQGIIRNP